MINLEIGSIVNFRGREWIVMPSPDDELINLRPIAGGEQDGCTVFLPIEGETIKTASFPIPDENDLGDFDATRLLRSAVRLLLRHGSGPFRSFGHLNFRPRPYQLVPLLMALKLSPVRMLIADDVGIGKTIETGLIARELLDRGEIRRLAVVCPSYLCDQWKQELQEKFSIAAKVIRSNTLARLEKELPRPSLSVFEYFPFFVTSIDYVKSDRRRDAFLQHAPELVIIDEAHGCARPAGQSTTQQQRHQLIADLARDAKKHILLVTATPHSGFDQSFQSLIGLIDPAFERFELDRLSKDQRAVLAKHFIQRRRRDVEQWMGTETRFPERIPLEVPFRLSEAYKAFFQDVYRFAREIVISDNQAQNARKRVRYWAALALLRCVMSSPAAAAAALRSRLEKNSDGEQLEITDHAADVYDPTEIEAAVDLVPSHVLAEGSEQLNASERRSLLRFVKRIESLTDENDAKIATAEQEVRKLLAANEKPIIFCRFIATADYVAAELKKRLAGEFPYLHVISVTGALSEEERVLRVAELGEAPQRLLVATDCLSEGINLQEKFNAVLHYDLPWNPNRLEQREGRVDRYGQTSGSVKTVLLYGADNPVDGAVLDVLLRKARRIHKSLGIIIPLPKDSESVMDALVHALFLRGNESAQLGLFDDEAPIVEVQQEWDRAAQRQQKSHTLFAQHAIKPEVVDRELHEADNIFGNAEVVKRFVLDACARLGAPLRRTKEHWRLTPDTLPQSLRYIIAGMPSLEISFEQPQQENVVYISRNHPFVTALSEHLLDTALDPTGGRDFAARFSVLRTDQIQSVTTLLLLRLRFLIKHCERETQHIAEECLLAGYRDEGNKKTWLKQSVAEDLFENIIPSANVLDAEKKYWVKQFIEEHESLRDELNRMAEKRAENLLQTYRRLRKAINGHKTSVEVSLPLDLLTVMVILPVPDV